MVPFACPTDDADSNAGVVLVIYCIDVKKGFMD
jgi:hypothetical protein